MGCLSSKKRNVSKKYEPPSNSFSKPQQPGPNINQPSLPNGSYRGRPLRNISSIRPMIPTQRPKTNVYRFQHLNKRRFLSYQPRLTNLSKIEIYWNCIHQPSCTRSGNNQPFKHQVCQTQAYLQNNGCISCDSFSCRQFQAKDACFDCVRHVVYEKSTYNNNQNIEVILNQQWFAQFIEHCFSCKSYDESQAWDFRTQVSVECMKQFLDT